MNPTTKMYHAAAYDRELAWRVYKVYQEDFENFGYDRDSWLFDYSKGHAVGKLDKGDVRVDN